MAERDWMEIRDSDDNLAARSRFTTLRVEKSPKHWCIHAWNRGGYSGAFTVDAADGPYVVNALIPLERQVTPKGGARDG